MKGWWLRAVYFCDFFPCCVLLCVIYCFLSHTSFFFFFSSSLDPNHPSPKYKVLQENFILKIDGAFFHFHIAEEKNPTVLISSIFNAIVSVKKKKKGTHAQSDTHIL